jgi:methylthioribulose-1-phosphate dehydratase
VQGALPWLAAAIQGKMAPEYSEIEKRLAELGRNFYARGWALGTSGNYSAVVSRDPLRITITPTGVDKGNLTPEQFVRIDANGTVKEGRGQPSAETALHLVVIRVRGAGAVFHTHSVWSTIVSDVHAACGGLWIEGYEMLKGLQGVRSHAHREWLPIIENDQDMPKLAGVIEALLKERPEAHGFLLRGHGLYTWGEDPAEAKRHLEILEFLLEIAGRLGRTDDHPSPPTPGGPGAPGERA